MKIIKFFIHANLALSISHYIAAQSIKTVNSPRPKIHKSAQSNNIGMQEVIPLNKKISSSTSSAPSLEQIKLNIENGLKKTQQNNSNLSEHQATQKLLEKYTNLVKNSAPDTKTQTIVNHQIQPRIDILNQKITNYTQSQNIAIENALQKIQQKNPDFSPKKARETLVAQYKKASDQNISPKIKSALESRIEILNQQIAQIENLHQQIIQLRPKTLKLEPIVTTYPEPNKKIPTKDLLNYTQGMDHKIEINNILTSMNPRISPENKTLILLNDYNELILKYSNSKKPTDQAIAESIIRPRLKILKQRWTEYNEQNTPRSQSLPSLNENKKTSSQKPLDEIINQENLTPLEKAVLSNPSNLQNNQFGIKTYIGIYDKGTIYKVTVKDGKIIDSTDPSSASRFQFENRTTQAQPAIQLHEQQMIAPEITKSTKPLLSKETVKEVMLENQSLHSQDHRILSNATYLIEFPNGSKTFVENPYSAIPKFVKLDAQNKIIGSSESMNPLNSPQALTNKNSAIMTNNDFQAISNMRYFRITDKTIKEYSNEKGNTVRFDENNNLIYSNDPLSPLNNRTPQLQERINQQKNQTTQAIVEKKTTIIPEINKILNNKENSTPEAMNKALIELAQTTKDFSVLVKLQNLDLDKSVVHAAEKARIKMEIKETLQNKNLSLTRKIESLRDHNIAIKNITGKQDPLIEKTMNQLQTVLKNQGEVSIKTAWEYWGFPFSNEGLSTLFTTIKSSTLNLFVKGQSANAKIRDILKSIDNVESQIINTPINQRTPQWNIQTEKNIMNIYDAAAIAAAASNTGKNTESILPSLTQEQISNEQIRL